MVAKNIRIKRIYQECEESYWFQPLGETIQKNSVLYLHTNKLGNNTIVVENWGNKEKPLIKNIRRSNYRYEM